MITEVTARACHNKVDGRLEIVLVQLHLAVVFVVAARQAQRQQGEWADNL